MCKKISSYWVSLVILFVPRLFAQDFDFIPHSGNTVIVRHKYYTLSYVQQHHNAEWVAYKLESYMIVGRAKRSNKFKSDPDVPAGSALPADYIRSGYDRGHLCPAADMKWNAVAMEETFYMSNMSPQEPAFNRGIWKKLEEQVREWATELKTIYVVTGMVLDDKLPTIGPINKVSVPRLFYKIVLQYDNHKKKAIAFLMPNEGSLSPLTDYIVPIDSIEKLTRINFFPSLTTQMSEQLEKHVNISDWNLIVRNMSVRNKTSAFNRSSPYNYRRSLKTSIQTN